MYPPLTDPVTLGGDTLLDLAIIEGKLAIVKCLVIKCGVDIYGEHSVPNNFLFGPHTQTQHTHTHTHTHMNAACTA